MTYKEKAINEIMQMSQEQVCKVLFFIAGMEAEQQIQDFDDTDKCNKCSNYKNKEIK